MKYQSMQEVIAGTIRNLSSAALAACIFAVAPVLAQSTSAPEGDDGHLLPHEVGGINLDGGITWFFQGSDGNAAEDTTDLTYTLDLNIEAAVARSGKVVIALEAGNGSGIDGHLASLSSANYDAYITELSSPNNEFSAISISQAYYEGEYLDGRLLVDFGKLDIHSLYDDNAYANDETDQFLSAIFTRSAGTSYAELDQYYAPGIAATFVLGERAELTLVAANGTNSGFDQFSDRPYGALQLNLKPGFGGRDGNYRVYVIRDWRRYEDIVSGGTTENTAWGISFDQAIAGGVGVFARYSAQDDGVRENQVKSSWSLGALVEGGAWGRADDTLGIGYGSVNLNTDPVVVADFALAGIVNPDDETHLELFYKVGFSEHFTLTPDLQIISNNGGDGDSDTITVYGIRGQLNF